MSGLALTSRDDGIRLEVRVTPRSSRTAIDGERDGRLLIRVNAPPVEDAANAAVVELLRTTLALPRRNVAIVAGGRSRLKTVALTGVTADQVRRRLSDILGHPV